MATNAERRAQERRVRVTRGAKVNHPKSDSVPGSRNAHFAAGANEAPDVYASTDTSGAHDEHIEAMRNDAELS